MNHIQLLTVHWCCPYSPELDKKTNSALTVYAELEDQKDKSHMRLYLLHEQDSKYLLQCNVEIKLQSILYRMSEIIPFNKTPQAKKKNCLYRGYYY